LEIAEKVYFCMKNSKMLSFPEKELPIFRVARGALRVGEENLFFAKKIHK